MVDRRIRGTRTCRGSPPVRVGNAPRQRIELGTARVGGQHGDGAVELAQRVATRPARERRAGHRTVRVRTSSAPLTVHDPQRIARWHNGGRVPLRRDAAGELIGALRRGDAGRRRRQIEHGDGIVVGLGGKEPRAIGRQRQRVRRASFVHTIGWWIEEPAGHLSRARVDDRDPVGACRRHERPGAARVQHERRWMSPDFDDALAREASTAAVRHECRDGRTTPRRHVHVTVPGNADRIRESAGTESLHHPTSREIQDGERVAQVLRDVECPTVR